MKSQSSIRVFLIEIMAGLKVALLGWKAYYGTADALILCETSKSGYGAGINAISVYNGGSRLSGTVQNSVKVWKVWNIRKSAHVQNGVENIGVIGVTAKTFISIAARLIWITMRPGRL